MPHSTITATQAASIPLIPPSKAAGLRTRDNYDRKPSISFDSFKRERRTEFDVVYLFLPPTRQAIDKEHQGAKEDLLEARIGPGTLDLPEVFMAFGASGSRSQIPDAAANTPTDPWRSGVATNSIESEFLQGMLASTSSPRQQLSPGTWKPTGPSANAAGGAHSRSTSPPSTGGHSPPLSPDYEALLNSGWDEHLFDDLPAVPGLLSSSAQSEQLASGGEVLRSAQTPVLGLPLSGASGIAAGSGNTSQAFFRQLPAPAKEAWRADRKLESVWRRARKQHAGSVESLTSKATWKTAYERVRSFEELRQF